MCKSGFTLSPTEQLIKCTQYCNYLLHSEPVTEARQLQRENPKLHDYLRGLGLLDRVFVAGPGAPYVRLFRQTLPNARTTLNRLHNMVYKRHCKAFGIAKTTSKTVERPLGLRSVTAVRFAEDCDMYQRPLLGINEAAAGGAAAKNDNDKDKNKSRKNPGEDVFVEATSHPQKRAQLLRYNDQPWTELLLSELSGNHEAHEADEKNTKNTKNSSETDTKNTEDEAQFQRFRSAFTQLLRVHKALVPCTDVREEAWLTNEDVQTVFDRFDLDDTKKAKLEKANVSCDANIHADMRRHKTYADFMHPQPVPTVRGKSAGLSKSYVC